MPDKGEQAKAVNLSSLAQASRYTGSQAAVDDEHDDDFKLGEKVTELAIPMRPRSELFKKFSKLSAPLILSFVMMNI